MFLHPHHYQPSTRADLELSRGAAERHQLQEAVADRAQLRQPFRRPLLPRPRRA